jgi:hypothetical protein
MQAPAFAGRPGYEGGPATGRFFLFPSVILREVAGSTPVRASTRQGWILRLRAE